MRRHDKKKILSILAATFIIVAVTGTPPLSLAKKSKKATTPTAHSSAAAAARVAGSLPTTAAAKKRDHKPGPAWRTIGGTVKHIKGDTYMVEDYEGNQVQLYVGRETKKLRGNNKKVGDTVRAEMTRGGFSNSIQ